MFHPATPLLTRLRRHRGLWALAVAVMLIKLMAGTICLADGLDQRFASATGVDVPVLVDAVADASAHDDAGNCVLGEAGGCHCACAHSATLPTAAWPPIGAMDVHFVAPAVFPRRTPAFAGSLIRPPIA